MSCNSLKCCICLDHILLPLRLTCGHVFCRSCILDYLTTSSPTCPLCRHSVYISDCLACTVGVSSHLRSLYQNLDNSEDPTCLVIHGSEPLGDALAVELTPQNCALPTVRDGTHFFTLLSTHCLFGSLGKLTRFETEFPGTLANVALSENLDEAFFVLAAMFSGDFGIMRFILDHIPDRCLVRRDRFGATALHLLLRCQGGRELVAPLLSHDRVLFMTAEHCIPSLVPVINALIPTLRKDSQRFALVRALCRAKDRSAVIPLQLLVPNLPPGLHLQECFFSAVKNGNLDIVRCLLENGWDPDPSSRDGSVGQAVLQGSPDMVKVLLDYGASAKMPVGIMGSPFELALRSGNRECARLISEAGGAHADALISIILRHSKVPISAAELAVEFCPDVVSHQLNSQSILHYCAWKRCGHLIDTLVAAGASVSAETDDGATPITYAARSDRAVAVHRLIRHGADVNHADSLGCRPIHYAVARRSFHALEALLQGGATIQDVFTKDGESPLFLACRARYELIARRLLSAGALVSEVSSEGRFAGRLPLAVVCEQGLASIAEVLLEYGASLDDVDPMSGKTCRSLIPAEYIDDFAISE